MGVDGLQKLQCFAFALRAGDPCSFPRHARLGVLWAGTVRDGARIVESAVVPLPRSYPGVRILRLGQR